MFQPAFDYLASATTQPGEMMGLAIAAQPRLFSMVIGLFVLATATTSEAMAKGEDELATPECTGVFEDIEKDVRKRDASTDNPPAVVELAEFVFDQEPGGSMLATVKDACWDAAYDAREKTWRLPALACAGDAAKRAAQFGEQRGENNLFSYCAYHSMVRIAERELPDDKSTRATALAGQGAALVALRGGGAKSRDYALGAVAAYEEAVELEATQERLFALANLHIDLGRIPAASKVIEDLKNGNKALALVALTELKRRKNKDLGEIVQDLSEARRAAPESQTVNHALGIAYFETKQYAQAREAFEAVHADDAIEDAGKQGPKVRADAYYFLAELDAQEANTRSEWAAVQENARRAYDIIGGDVRYRRLLCLSSLAKGFGRNDSKDAPFCEGKDSAEGKLLYGLYQFRLAQHIQVYLLGGGRQSQSEIDFRDHLAKAERAFSDAADELGPKDKGRKVEWPHLDPQPDLEQTIAYGEELVDWGGSFCRGPLDAGPEPVVAFYERYLGRKKSRRSSEIIVDCKAD